MGQAGRSKKAGLAGVEACAGSPAGRLQRSSCPCFACPKCQIRRVGLIRGTDSSCRWPRVDPRPSALQADILVRTGSMGSLQPLFVCLTPVFLEMKNILPLSARVETVETWSSWGHRA